MGNRLSKIVTRTGDAGMTGLGDGSRIAKDSLRIAAIGDIDELNSTLGVVLAEDLPNAVRDTLLGVQNDLFDLGGEICIPGSNIIGEAHILRLEDAVTTFNDALPPLKEFILPGGSRAAALTHLARTVCRRAERGLVQLSKEGAQPAEDQSTDSDAVSSFARKYLNRLSDLLFVLGRALNAEAGRGDVLWKHDRSK